MTKARALLQQIRGLLRGYQQASADSSMPAWVEWSRGEYRFYCGDPRDKGPRRSGFTFKSSGYTLIFEILARETKQGWDYPSFSIHLTNVGQASIFFHRDPARASWPDHPETHIQFEAPADTTQAAPFLNWRLPAGEIDPIRCLEYLAAKAAHRDGAGR